MSFFRREVYQARSAQWLGTVRLTRPVGFAVVTSAALLAAVLFIAFVSFGEVNRKARLTGLLVPALGSINIAAPQAGVVSQRRIAQGDVVQPGDILMVIDTERQSLVSNHADGTESRLAQQIEARRQSLQGERRMRELQTQQRDQALRDRLRTIDAELRQSDEEMLMQRRRLDLSRKTTERFQQLAKEGFVSEVQAQSKQEELIDVTTKLRSMERARLALTHDRQVVAQDRNAALSQLQTELSQLERSEVVLNQEAAENASKKSAVVSVPTVSTQGGVARSFRVTAMNLVQGQSVQAGQTLATLVPESSTGENALEAHLFAPSRSAGFLRVGQWVYLRYAAYPFQKFGLHRGRVVSVSDSPFALSDLPNGLASQLAAQVGAGEALYRVCVRLDEQHVNAFGQAQALKPGLTLEADVLQDRRAIWEWILEPIFAARTQVKVLGAQPKPNHGGEGGQ